MVWKCHYNANKLNAKCNDDQRIIDTSKVSEIMVQSTRNKEDTQHVGKSTSVPLPLFITGSNVNPCESFIFLEAVISPDLYWQDNSDSIIKKVQQRISN